MRLILVNLILLLFFNVFAQDKKALDSLTEQAKGINLTKKVTALNELCRIYTGIDNTKAMNFVNQAIDLSTKSKDLKLLAQSKNRLGTIYDYKGVLDSANINYQEALKLFEQQHDKSGIAAVYQNIGVMYYFQNDLDKAIEYYNKAIVLRNKTNELEFVAKLQNNIAVILRRQKKYDLAIEYYKKSLEIKKRFKDSEAVATAYSNIAVAYLYSERFDSAKVMLNRALVTNQSIKSNINLAGNYFTLAEIFFNEKKYNDTKLQLKKSEEFAKKAESNDVMYNIYELLWQVDTATGEYKNAVYNQHIASTYKAKVFKDEKAKAVEKLNVLYETEKKDREITSLNVEKEKKKIQNRLLVVGLSLTFLILVITAFYFKKIKDKNALLSFQKREIENKTEVLNKQAAEIARHQSQMNPHFIFNALVSVQNFILKENKQTAVNYLSQLSKLMRLTLYNSEKDYITLKEEKGFLDFYIDFEKSRFENIFISTFIIDKTIDIENTLIPPMIMQPFIENAVKHGLLPKLNGGELFISIYKSENYLIVEIKDNGVGRQKVQTDNNENHKSKGLHITINRIKTVNRINGLDEANCCEIIDLKDSAHQSAGTQVIIKLPFLENF